MGNCQLPHHPDNRTEIQVMPHSIYEEKPAPNDTTQNRSKMIFNHNAKDYFSYQQPQPLNNQNYPMNNDGHMLPHDLINQHYEENQFIEEDQHDPDQGQGQGQVFQQIMQQASDGFLNSNGFVNNTHNSQVSGGYQSQANQQQFQRQHTPSQSQYASENQQPSFPPQNLYQQQYIGFQIDTQQQQQQDMDFDQYRRELEQQIQAMEREPPRTRPDLPPFNYGEDPVYPLDYHIEIRPAHRLPDGSTYVGEWNGDRITGKGVMEGENGKYEGFWLDGHRHGRGRFTYPEGDIYEGDWVNDKVEGMGTFYNMNGTIYTGEWRNEKRHGVGKEVFPNGSSYEGEYDNDRKHGQGVFIWRDGTKYTGEFSDNKINGYGVMEYSNGRRYEGYYRNGLMHGKGKFEWPDKRVYEGEYADDRKHGMGVLTFPDGRKYEGSWNRGAMNGEGLLTIGNKKRKGHWLDGKRIKWID